MTEQEFEKRFQKVIGKFYENQLPEIMDKFSDEVESISDTKLLLGKTSVLVLEINTEFVRNAFKEFFVENND